MNEQLSRDDLIKRNIIKRPSISRSLQPNAEALENELLRNLAKYNQEKTLQFESINNSDHPLFKNTVNSMMSNGYHNNNNNYSMDDDDIESVNHRRKGRHQRKASGFGTRKNQNPTYYKHDIAPRLHQSFVNNFQALFVLIVLPMPMHFLVIDLPFYLCIIFLNQLILV